MNLATLFLARRGGHIATSRADATSTATAARPDAVHRAALVAVTGAALVAGALVVTDPGAPAADAATSGTGATVASTALASPELGVYTAPGPRAITGAAAYSAFTGRRVDRVLDFLNQSSWLEITRNRWLLDPYTGSGYQLHLSVPMLPSSEPTSLAQCAAGDYDASWTQVGQNLVASGQDDATVRPGWEMNGGWYKWAAAGKVADYAGCFRSLVRAMRAVPGQHFTFAFCVNLGGGTFPAEQAYPGDAYVDYVGVDVYDTSWSVYPPTADLSWQTARERAWAWIERGDHGLAFWSSFAIAHGKRLGIDEWALTWRSDGHGGGDDSYYVDHLLDYVLDPSHAVAYAMYFDATDSATLKHDVLLSTSVFPAGRAELARRLSGLAATPVTVAPSSTSSVRTSTSTARTTSGSVSSRTSSTTRKRTTTHRPRTTRTTGAAAKARRQLLLPNTHRS